MVYHDCDKNISRNNIYHLEWHQQYMYKQINSNVELEILFDSYCHMSSDKISWMQIYDISSVSPSLSLYLYIFIYIFLNLSLAYMMQIDNHGNNQIEWNWTRHLHVLRFVTEQDLIGSRRTLTDFNYIGIFHFNIVYLQITLENIERIRPFMSKYIYCTRILLSAYVKFYDIFADQNVTNFEIT